MGKNLQKIRNNNSRAYYKRKQENEEFEIENKLKIAHPDWDSNKLWLEKTKECLKIKTKLFPIHDKYGNKIR